mmetsp:Transcript_11765/g.28540  ORF Transcript_11765/g.28540 Transcript_11765/m.28540 type:complete len:285 (-) Transcript_11765:470-1324(-)
MEASFNRISSRCLSCSAARSPVALRSSSRAHSSCSPIMVFSTSQSICSTLPHMGPFVLVPSEIDQGPWSDGDRSCRKEFWYLGATSSASACRRFSSVMSMAFFASMFRPSLVASCTSGEENTERKSWFMDDSCCMPTHMRDCCATWSCSRTSSTVYSSCSAVEMNADPAVALVPLPSGAGCGLRRNFICPLDFFARDPVPHLSLMPFRMTVKMRSCVIFSASFANGSLSAAAWSTISCSRSPSRVFLSSRNSFFWPSASSYTWFLSSDFAFRDLISFAIIKLVR